MCRCQIIFIILNLLMLIVQFTNTQPFRAGLLRLMVNCRCLPTLCDKRRPGEFNAAVYVTLFYLLSVIFVRVWSVMALVPCNGSSNPCYPQQNLPYQLLNMALPCVSVAYYYFFKRAIFDICDPKYYRSDSQWFKQAVREY